MCAINRVIGSTEKQHEEKVQAKKEVVSKVIDDYIATPFSLLFNAVLFGVCFGIVVYCTVTGLMLALKW